MTTNRLDPGAYDALRAEVRGTPQARLHHRLHAVLLVAGGLSCRAAALCLGDSPRTVEHWVNQYKRNKISGLSEIRPKGRPSRLSEAQLGELRAALGAAPPGGARSWTGAGVADLAARRWGVALGARQGQRILLRLRGS